MTTQHQTINKSFGTANGNFDQLNWEIYGGYIDFDKRHYIKKGGSYNQTPEKSYLIGSSFAYNFPVLSGIRFQMSNYGFDKFIVQETNISVAVNNYLFYCLARNVRESW